MRKQRQTGCSSPGWTLNVFNQAAEPIAFGISDSHGRIENLFGYFSHAMQQSTASS
jgi:hypothetical protein